MSRTYGDSSVTSYSYDPASQRLTGISAPGLSLGYTYTPAGNVQTLSDGGQTTTFGYDALDRLTSASGAYTATYSYSPDGNLLNKSEGGVSTSLGYPPDNSPAPTVRPHAAVTVTVGGTQQTYNYDANGNLTHRPGQTLSYDAEHRLIGVSGPVTATYSYDGDGQLVRRDTAEGTTLYLGPYLEAFAPAHPPEPPLPPTPPPGLTHRHYLPLVSQWGLQVNGQTPQLTKYYLVNGQRIAVRTGSAPVIYLYQDALGSTSATSANTNNSMRYWPYGATRSGTLDTPYRYTGQRIEPTGLYFYQARWYDPALGRFLQPDTIVPDPANPQSLNRYAYGLGNPVKCADPTGQWVETAFDIVSVGFDIAVVKQDPSLPNIGALIVDAAAVIVPVVPSGAGRLARGGKAAVEEGRLAVVQMEANDKVVLLARTLRLTDRLRRVGHEAAG